MSIQYTIGVLVPIWGEEAPPPPADRPIGRVAMACEARGIRLVFATHVTAGRMSGWVVREGRWEAVEQCKIDAVYDRYPDQTRPAQHAATLEALQGISIFNAPLFTTLCRDKLALQSFMVDGGLRMPEVDGRRERFSDCLAAWGAAFIKPQFGSFGRGVKHVTSEEVLQTYLNEADPNQPLILQRAVAPPSEWRGICLRVLLQRDEGGCWNFNPGVARTSMTDEVVNAARGAEVSPAVDVLDGPGRASLEHTLRRIGQRVDALPTAERIIEMGVDLVLDAQRQPVLIEINGRPRGRLAVLANAEPSRFAVAHQRAMLRPFQCITGFLNRQ